MRADQVVIAGRSRPNVKIVGYELGQLQFRDADGITQSVWLNEIESLHIDRAGGFNDFNDAERYRAKGDADDALVRYRRALRVMEDFWPEIIEVRVLQTCDRPPLIDQAATAFVRVVRGKRSGPAAAVRLIPGSMSDQRSVKSAAALDTLQSALESNSSDDARFVLEEFRFTLLRRIGDPAAATAARFVAMQRPSAALRCELAYRTQRMALEVVLSDGATDEELDALDAFIYECPEVQLPAALILKGEALLAQANAPDRLIRASWPYLRVAAHMPDDDLAPDAMLAVGRILERLGRFDKGLVIMEECLAHRKISAATRRSAQELIQRLRAGETE